MMKEMRSEPLTRCRAGSSAAALLGGRPGALLGVLSEVARFREDVPAQLSAAARCASRMELAVFREASIKLADSDRSDLV